MSDNQIVRALFVELRIGDAQGLLRESIHGQAARAVVSYLENEGFEAIVYQLELDMEEVRRRGKVLSAIPVTESGIVMTIGSETRHFRNPYDAEPVAKPSQGNRQARRSLLSRLRKKRK